MQTYLRAEYLVHRVQFITAYWKFSSDFDAVGKGLVRLADSDSPSDLLILYKMHDSRFSNSSKNLSAKVDYYQWIYRLNYNRCYFDRYVHLQLDSIFKYILTYSMEQSPSWEANQ